jgi:hypothetical protein
MTEPFRQSANARANMLRQKRALARNRPTARWRVSRLNTIGSAPYSKPHAPPCPDIEDHRNVISLRGFGH